MDSHVLLLAILAFACPLGSVGLLGPPHLTRCPSQDLTLTVPADLRPGLALFSWDPERLAVQSSRDAYKRAVTKALNSGASASARAFFAEAGPEDVFSLEPGLFRAVLTRPLPRGSDFVHGRFHLFCSPVPPASAPAGPRASAGSPRTGFRVHLRLIRSPPTALPQVAPAGVDLAAARSLWRSPVSHFRAAAAGADAVAALALTQMRIGLGPLLQAAPRSVRVRLLETSDRSRVRLMASSDGSPPSLLVALAPGDTPLSVTLEAVDPAGRSDETTLLVSAGELAPELPGRGSRWLRHGWWLPGMVAAAGLVALSLAVCACLCACRRRRRAACVKPQFV